MKKLKLDIEELVVDSFESVAKGARPGTAFAHADTDGAPGCFPPPTQISCQANTCLEGCTAYVGFTCAFEDTCAAPCRLSDMTNCHRCTPDQTDPFYCG
ncbi:MAG TPA: hypothetical protein VFQ39_06220 [Longimicrobium sp.]|nr:hypothetical protein [Longimicrobium sp.]